MANLDEAKRAEFQRLLASLSLEQICSVTHFAGLLMLRQVCPDDPEVEAEIAAIEEAAHGGRLWPVPSVH